MSKRTTKQGEMSTITNSGLTTTVWISHACFPGTDRIWAIYYKSLTWFKAILGVIPLLNHHLGWPRRVGRYNLPSRMPLGLLPQKCGFDLVGSVSIHEALREEIGSTARHTGPRSPGSWPSGSLSIALSSDLPSFGRRIQQVSLVHALRIWTRMAVKTTCGCQ